MGVLFMRCGIDDCGLWGRVYGIVVYEMGMADARVKGCGRNFFGAAASKGVVSRGTGRRAARLNEEAG